MASGQRLLFVACTLTLVALLCGLNSSGLNVWKLLGLIYIHELSASSQIQALSAPSQIQELSALSAPSQGSHFRDRPRVLIFAGPHKTGSTAIQTLLLARNNSLVNALLREGWLIPSVPVKRRNGNDRKRHCPIINALLHRNVENELVCGIRGRGENILDILREQTCANAPMRGLILATELFDNIASKEDSFLVVDSLHTILDCRANGGGLPPVEDTNAKDSLRVVIVYRAPRWEHARSLWQELAKPQTTFLRWVCTWSAGVQGLDWHGGRYAFFGRKSQVLRPISLSQNLVEAGVHVVLVDYASVTRYHVGGLQAAFISSASILNISHLFTLSNRSTGWKHVSAKSKQIVIPKAAQTQLEYLLSLQDCSPNVGLQNWSSFVSFLQSRADGTLESRDASQFLQIDCSGERLKREWASFSRQFCS